jgi:hypothetical protein
MQLSFLSPEWIAAWSTVALALVTGLILFFSNKHEKDLVTEQKKLVKEQEKLVGAQNEQYQYLSQFLHVWLAFRM